jgi:Fur family transcriptional regulator, zinc uptake regulator
LFLEIGIVRRVESKHAYRLVDPAGDPGDILLMCEDCGGVTAIGTGQVRSAVAAQSEAAGFHPTRQVIEVAGLCRDCDNARGQHV